jgi:hypothetical protein
MTLNDNPETCILSRLCLNAYEEVIKKT